MRTFMKWTLAVAALVPILYAKSVLVPSMSLKSLVLRALILIVALGTAYLFSSNPAFRAEAGEKVRRLWKLGLFKAVTVSYVLLGVSTIFAHDRFLAFLGTVERAEGFVGLSFFYLLFFFAAFLFEEKDWKRFFCMSLISGWILFIGELVQLAHSPVRPGSLVGNPIYLAGYFLFVIYAGLAFYRQEKVSVRWIGLVSAGMAVLGIFLTQSRGVMLGLAVGLVVVLAYLSFQNVDRMTGTMARMRSVSRMALIVLVLFIGIFAGTRHAAVWQKVPGLNRVAAISLSDNTTASRVVLTGISIKAVNPATVGVKTMLVGWGWDNYEFAWERFYQPRLYGIDPGLLDRSHDKLLDVLVMTGLFGLLAYLAIWIFFVREIFRWGRRDLFAGAAALFWATAFFVQNLSAFDSLVTYVAFFSMLAFVAGSSSEPAVIELKKYAK